MKAYEHRDLQELLPAYLEQSLRQEERDLVDRHVASCEDCWAELMLLRAMAAEPVPDPGEAFWAAFPGRVYREIGQQPATERPRSLAGLLDRFRVPRWAWATAAGVVLLATIAWYGLHPAPIKMAAKQLPDAGGIYVDVLASEQVRISELSSPEIRSLDSWANKELASLSLQEGAADMFLNAPEGALEERMADMNREELEHLSSMLDTENEEDGT